MKVFNKDKEEFNLDIKFDIPKGEYSYYGDKLEGLSEFFEIPVTVDVINLLDFTFESKGVRVIMK